MKVRRKISSWSIRRNWKENALKSSNAIRQTFRNVGVSVVLSSDETFIRFYESCDSCVAPVGVNRVGLGSIHKGVSS